MASANQFASRHDYVYDDYDLSLDGIYYYRIKQVDKDGLYTYSKVIAIKKSNNHLLNVEIYPNPVREIMKVEIEIGMDGNIESEILDETGRTVLEPSFAGYKKSGKFSFDIDLGILASGTYILKIKNPHGIVNKKFGVTK
ncbi:MAG: T9SS type A sorting domain-containing protein [Saprospiraceae bacterium]